MSHSQEPTARQTTPTAILRHEHDVILKVLSVLERLASPARAIEPSDWERVLDFLRNYADTNHHMKEEDALFPALIDCGLPRDGGPVAVMLAEHQEGRRLVRGMQASLDDAPTQPQADSALRNQARQFIALLRDHIDKENQVLFTMAESMIPPDTMNELLESFADAARTMGEDTLQRYEDLAAALDAQAQD